ncbi:S1C family serine protease [Bacillus suaedae]|uniref:Trypsin-like peptidase domain-containing protein n=1 Tax=Halalkalibacter suaedae TaxID=2822140 RepID=A0A940WPR9_9BACI|nr:serine protease [Bacillus suaedae]MBP3950285.1 trypsin-like peptidase domain-containing protein [Bacillus suaedae]
MKETDEEEVEFEEPAPEDFLFDEEETVDEKDKKRRKTVLFRVIGLIVAVVLILQVGNIWFNILSEESRELTETSEELSQQEDVSIYKEAVVAIQGNGGRGTGFSISDNGYILTNHHVVSQRQPLTVSFPNGDYFTAEIVESMEEPDLALLKVDGEDLPFLTLRSSDAKENEDIYVIGNPRLQTQIVNEGQILNNENPFQRMRISNKILPGHSGSPVIAQNGEVVGVVYARSLGTEEGYGLAIPVGQVYDYFPSLQELLDE